MIGLSLGDACSDGPYADFRYQFDRYRRFGIRVLKIVDELRQVLDRVNVVVWRRRDEPYPGTVWRTLAMYLDTLWPGSCPPSPGFAP